MAATSDKAGYREEMYSEAAVFISHGRCGSEAKKPGKERGVEKGRDSKEIKGRRAGNRRRGEKERHRCSVGIKRRKTSCGRYTEVGQSRGKIRAE